LHGACLFDGFSIHNVCKIFVIEVCSAGAALLWIMDDSTAASSATALPEDLEARVTRVIAKTQRIPLETVSIDSTFEELKIDSLDGINLIFALESEFNVDIPDEDARAIRSVRQMAEGIAQLLAQKTPEQGVA
jgi:acyl carrier protein